MKHLLGHYAVVVLVMGTFALVGCKSPEVKARNILDKHAAQYVECQKQLDDAEAKLEKSLAALAGGDSAGSSAATSGSDAILEEAEKCLNEVKGKIEADRQAAGVDGEAFAKVWGEWIVEMEAKAGE